MSGNEVFWLTVGFTGQAAFTSRFLVQWIASERRGESVIPVAFWYLSLTGGWLLLAYAVYRQDPVIITGQALGVVVYLRNLLLIHRQRGWGRRDAGPGAGSDSPTPAENPPVIELPKRRAG